MVRVCLAQVFGEHDSRINEVRHPVYSWHGVCLLTFAMRADPREPEGFVVARVSCAQFSSARSGAVDRAVACGAGDPGSIPAPARC